MKMKSIARVPFKYGGALVQPHAEFSVKSARDVKVLTAARRAALLTEPAAAPAPAKAPSKRTYKRRDMVAEPAAAAQATTELTPPDVWPFPTTTAD